MSVDESRRNRWQETRQDAERAVNSELLRSIDRVARVKTLQTIFRVTWRVLKVTCVLGIVWLAIATFTLWLLLKSEGKEGVHVLHRLEIPATKESVVIFEQDAGAFVRSTFGLAIVPADVKSSEEIFDNRILSDTSAKYSEPTLEADGMTAWLRVSFNYDRPFGANRLVIDSKNGAKIIVSIARRSE